MRTVLLVAFVLASGCSGLEEREHLSGRTGALSGTSVDVQVRAAYEVTDPTKLPSARFSPKIDAAAVASLTLERVVGGPVAVAGRIPSTSSVVRFLRLEADLVQASVRYEGQRGIWGLKLFFTIFFFPIDFPNYFISSDRFALTLTARWKLVEQEQVVAEGTCQGKQVGYFGDFSRGWYFVGYLRMPSPLDAEEWQEIADQLIPGAQDALAEALVLDAEKALAAPPKK